MKKNMRQYDIGYYAAWGESMAALIRMKGPEGERLAKELMAVSSVTVRNLEDADVDYADLLPVKFGFEAYNKGVIVREVSV